MPIFLSPALGYGLFSGIKGAISGGSGGSGSGGYKYGLLPHEAGYFLNYGTYGKGGQEEIEELQRLIANMQKDQTQAPEWRVKAINAYNERLRELQNQASRAPGGYSIKLPDPTPYFDEAKINALYRVLAANLGQRQASTMANVGSRGAAVASAGGFANPLAYQRSLMSDVAGQYAPAFGALEAKRGESLIGNQQALLAALMKKAQLEEESRQFNVSDDYRRDALRQQWEQFLQQLAFQQDQAKVNWFDILSLLAAAGSRAATSAGMGGGAGVGGM